MTDLSDMSLEELWELFPIRLVPHKDAWSEQYNRMQEKLSDMLSAFDIARIDHIGSTAVDGIMAKDIVDILVEIEEGENLPDVAQELEAHGFSTMSASRNRISLNIGYTDKGFAEEVFHIHLRHKGDNDELYFRDYMRDNPAQAEAYENLKTELWKRFEHDRNGYTNAKTEFIRDATRKAKASYGNRY